jgi:hypothetical protein
LGERIARHGKQVGPPAGSQHSRVVDPGDRSGLRCRSHQRVSGGEAETSCIRQGGDVGWVIAEGPVGNAGVAACEERHAGGDEASEGADDVGEAGTEPEQVRGSVLSLSVRVEKCGSQRGAEGDAGGGVVLDPLGGLEEAVLDGGDAGGNRTSDALGCVRMGCTGTPSRSASSLQAASSSAVYCGANGLVRGVRLPPVAKILMRSAPSLTWRRTARRISGAVSHWWLNQWQWPPVTVIGWPLVLPPLSRPRRRLGPSSPQRTDPRRSRGVTNAREAG